VTATIQTLLLLIAVLVVVAVVARRFNTAPSILLVIAGIALALIPGLPRIELAPELVLLGILPPLIYSAGVAMSWREFRFNLWPITLLAVGCVVFTTCAVAAVAHWLLGMSLAVGFVLGAIVSPPDVVAPLSIVRRLGVTASLESRDHLTLLDYVLSGLRDMRFCSLQMSLQHLSIDRIKPRRRVFLLLRQTPAGISDHIARPSKQVHVNIQKLITARSSFVAGNVSRPQIFLSAGAFYRCGHCCSLVIKSLGFAEQWRRSVRSTLIYIKIPTHPDARREADRRHFFLGVISDGSIWQRRSRHVRFAPDIVAKVFLHW